MNSPLLRVERLAKSFGALVVTDDVNFSVNEGRLVALIGPNGAGKTTLINQLSGALQSRRGTNPIRRRRHNGARHAGARRTWTGSVVPDRSRACPNTARSRMSRLAVQARSGSSFRFFGYAAREEALNAPARAALKRVGLLARSDDRPGELSHGEKRSLEIAMALALRPRLMLLDEPFAGLGSDETRASVDLIRELKSEYAMLLVEHDMDAVFALADEIGVLVNGRLIAWGTPNVIRADARVRSAYLGEEALA